ncbi:MAG: hypothetical protein KC777_07010 [Cyanobacteria bacterium HKST-UBA02]|nr:hypothetical protein [Cyanobacteria bacterium HKST-UBA02]
MPFRALLYSFSLLALICLGTPACEAKLTLASIFGDHMVLQQGKPVKIWGTADPGAVVGIRIGDRKQVAHAGDDGKWLASVEPPPAGGPYQITVVSDTKIVVDDVMVGEVWLCGGQSNMVLTNSDLKTRGEEDPGQRKIRFITLPPVASSEPEADFKGTWRVLDRDSEGLCSVLAGSFGATLEKDLGVPVGLVISAVGGSRVQAWISKPGLERFNTGKSVAEKLDKTVESLKKRRLPSRSLALSVDEKDVNAEAVKALFLSGATLYNAMIAPLVPFTFKGVIWYQGEANVYEGANYQRFLSELIKDWRLAFENPEIPFIYVQLPPFGKLQTAPSDSGPLAKFREAQTRISIFPYSFMAVTTDCCPSKDPDWHASDKQKIGRRLARIALATQYKKPYKFRSPVLGSFKKEGKKVRLRFRNVTQGLKASGDALEGFAIAGDDKRMVWAEAAIDGDSSDSVLVWSDEISDPKVVTYAWADNPRGNLLGDDNLPAVPFRAEFKAY